MGGIIETLGLGEIIGDALAGTAAADAAGTAAAATAGEVAGATIPEVVVTGTLPAATAGLSAADLAAAGIATAGTVAPGVAAATSTPPGVQPVTTSPLAPLGTTSPGGAPTTIPGVTAPNLSSVPATGTAGASGSTTCAGAAAPGVSTGLPSDLTAQNLSGVSASNLTSPSASSLPGLTATTPTDTFNLSATGPSSGINFGGTTPASTIDSSLGAGVQPVGSPVAGAPPPTTAQQIGGALGIGPQTSQFIGSNIGSIAGPVVAGAGLISNLTQGNANSSQIKALQTSADNLTAQGQQLQSYLNTGTLPAGAQAAVNQATNSQKAAIRSQYASMGITSGTMLTQALNEVDQAAAGMVFQYGTQLAQAGVNQVNLADELLSNIISINQKQQATTSASISNLAAALAGRSPTTTPTGG